MFLLSAEMRGQPNGRRFCRSKVFILHSRVVDSQGGYLAVLSSREQTDWEFARVELDDEIARAQFKMPEYIQCSSGAKFRKLAPITASLPKPTKGSGQ